MKREEVIRNIDELIDEMNDEEVKDFTSNAICYLIKELDIIEKFDKENNIEESKLRECFVEVINFLSDVSDNEYLRIEE